MADNITLNSNTTSGSSIRTDDDGAHHWQYVKVAFGADNTQTIVSAADGLPVNTELSAVALMADTTANPTVTSLGTFSMAYNGSTWDRMRGDATNGLLVNLGANNDVAVTGTVTANLSATDNAVLDQLEVNTSYGDNTGGGTEAAALRVTLANNSTGLLSVDDNGGSLTVDGTVTANLSATDNAVLDQLEVNTSYGDNTGGGVESGALRVTLANNSTGLLSVDDNGGSLTVDSATLTTIAGAVAGSEMQCDVVTQPARAAATDTTGAVLSTSAIANGVTQLTPKFAKIDAASSGDNTLVAAVVGKKVRILQVILVAAAAVNVRFESGAGGTALTGQMNLTTNSGFEASFSPVGHFETASNTLLNLELSGAVSVDGWLVYVEV